MLLIGNPLVVTRWSNFIHRCRSWRCHSWSCCRPYRFPLFGKLCSRFKKYHFGKMTCATWLSFPINDSSVYFLIFAEDNASFISVAQSVCFSFGRNALREWVCMSYCRHILCSASFTYPASFLKESGSSRFRGSYGYSGRNSVWMTNIAALFARSIQCFPSTIMVMMSSMNPSIGASVAVMSTSRDSAFER